MGFECYRIGDLLLDAGTQEVTRNGNTVQIPRLSFKLLLSLARHAPNIVSAEQLEEEVWEGLVVDRGTVNKRVLLLRRALAEGEGSDDYISVVRGSGYRLVVEVERVPDPSEKPKEDTPARLNWVRRASETQRITLYWIIGIVAVLALHQKLVDHSVDTPSPVTAESVSQNQVLNSEYSQKFIAVLPFVDLSDGHIHQYLGDGIAEEVINLLAGMDGLEVAARTSSFNFRDTTGDLSEISASLKVGTILEGSIRHTDDRIRVTAQLIDGQTGFHVWSKNYDRTFNEIFEVQDDIASSIAESLKLTLGEGDQPDSRKTSTDDIDAFSLYLKGRRLFNDRIHLRADGLREALDYFSQAIERDPGFARAHADTASVYWLLTTYDDTVDQDTYFEQAEASANFALEFEPESTEALSALASVSARRGDIEQAALYLERVRAIGSSDSNIVHWDAMISIRLGYFEKLIDPLTRAYRLDPLNEHIGWSLATALNFAGKPDMAVDILEKLEHFTYRQYVLGLAAINGRDYERARKLLREVRMRTGILPAAFADILVDALKDPDLVEAAARKMMDAVAKGEFEAATAFEALLLLGSPSAFDLDLNPLHDIERINVLAQVWNNWAVGLRQDPRFKKWVEALGYVNLWRKYGWPDRCAPTGPDDFECV